MSNTTAEDNIFSIKKRRSEFMSVLRAICQCPEISEREIKKYPPIMRMEDCVFEIWEEDQIGRFVSEVEVFPFVRELEDSSEVYIDIYIFEITGSIRHCNRFILRRGFHLEQKLEEQYFRLVEGFLHANPDCYKQFSKDVYQHFPEIHWQEYVETVQKNEMVLAFEHIYFSLYRSGPMELLYKAGLCNLGHWLPFIDDTDLMGSSPTAIFDLPIWILRIMEEDAAENDMFFDIFDYIFKIEDRKHLKDVFLYFRDVIRKKRPSSLQWLYLKKIFGMEIESNHVKAVYQLVGDVEKEGIGKEEIVQNYVLFHEQQKLLQDYYPYRGIPDLDKLEEVVSEQGEIIYLLASEDSINCQLKKRAKWSNLGGYEDSRYITVVPVSLKQFTREACIQSNCLIKNDYLQKILNGDSTLVFIRKKSEIQKPCITVEVSKDRTILQVYGLYNRNPTPHERKFVEKFAFHRALKFDNPGLCDDNQNDIINNDDIQGDDVQNIHQMTMFEYLNG